MSHLSCGFDTSTKSSLLVVRDLDIASGCDSSSDDEISSSDGGEFTKKILNKFIHVLCIARVKYISISSRIQSSIKLLCAFSRSLEDAIVGHDPVT